VNESFFQRPILNSPYAYSARHRELDDEGQPTNHIVESRRAWELITPVPKLQKRRRSPGQTELGLDATDGLSTTEQEYNPIPVINEIRGYVAAWRNCRTPEPRRTSRVIRPGQRRCPRRVIALRSRSNSVAAMGAIGIDCQTRALQTSVEFAALE
jgi:hypothetical protein